MFYGPMAVGGIVGIPQNQTGHRFLGTCFALRRPDYFVTAKHVVLGATGLKIAIGAKSETAISDVASVVVHPRADLAVMRTTGPRRYVPKEEPNSLSREPSRAERENAFFLDDVEPDETLTGVWYEAYGLITDLPTQTDQGGIGEGRCLRGYIHRRMSYSGPWGTYQALELSEGVPGGASGAPVYAPEDPRRVIAVGIGMIESVIPGQIVEENRLGEVSEIGPRPIVWRVGVGLLLSAYREWLDEQIPEIHSHGPKSRESGASRERYVREGPANR